jgi:hypothetical protein
VDFRRVGNFFFMGACVVAPCVRTWLLTLDRLVKAQGDTKIPQKLKKVSFPFFVLTYGTVYT